MEFFFLFLVHGKNSWNNSWKKKSNYDLYILNDSYILLKFSQFKQYSRICPSIINSIGDRATVVDVVSARLDGEGAIEREEWARD